MIVNCDYCQQPAQLVSGETLYPHRSDLHTKVFYLCRSCDAYVGCHGNGDRPLGRLANAELRQAKMDAHAVFDPLWRRRRFPARKRTQAYRWLAERLGINFKNCHIGMFDVATCRRVVEICRASGEGEGK